MSTSTHLHLKTNTELFVLASPMIRIVCTVLVHTRTINGKVNAQNLLERERLDTRRTLSVCKWIDDSSAFTSEYIHAVYTKEQNHVIYDCGKEQTVWKRRLSRA